MNPENVHFPILKLNYLAIALIIYAVDWSIERISKLISGLSSFDAYLKGLAKEQLNILSDNASRSLSLIRILRRTYLLRGFT